MERLGRRARFRGPQPLASRGRQGGGSARPLAEDLIPLSGLVPGKDVRIEFSGVRPGAKLYVQSEKVVPTAHPKVFSLKPTGDSGKDPALLGSLEWLNAMAISTDLLLYGLRQESRRLVRAPAPQGAVAS